MAIYKWSIVIIIIIIIIIIILKRKNSSAQKKPTNLFFKDFKLLTLWYSYQIFQEILEQIFRKHGFTEANSVGQCRCRP